MGLEEWSSEKTEPRLRLTLETATWVRWVDGGLSSRVETGSIPVCGANGVFRIRASTDPR